MGGPQAHGNSVESRALTHLESIGLGNAAFMSMGGPQAHGNSKPRNESFGSLQLRGLSVYNRATAISIRSIRFQKAGSDCLTMQPQAL